MAHVSYHTMTDIILYIVAEIAPWKIKKRLNDTTLSTGTRAHMSTNTTK
jgi:uncharacterized membrane protein YqjE